MNGLPVEEEVEPQELIWRNCGAGEAALGRGETGEHVSHMSGDSFVCHGIP